MLAYKLKNDVAFRERVEKQERNYVTHLSSQEMSFGSADYILPVVVHVIHQNGFENLSDNVVERAIEWLNDGFANQNYYDQDVGVDTRIQFCLAQRDPNGNATNGITHTVSTETNMTSAQALKNVIRWDTRRYINIWTVNYAGGPGGFATLPASHGSASDGIVVLSEKLRVIGSGHSTLIHELGHLFGFVSYLARWVQK